MKKYAKTFILIAGLVLPIAVTATEVRASQPVAVYVVDTGVRADHVALVGNVGSGFSNVNDALGTGDCNGHGTHVAGVVKSVAPSAMIIPVRTFDCGAFAWTSNIVAGIDWAIAHHQQDTPAVMNLSISGQLSNSLNAAVSRAIADGITVVVAAGNSAKDACGFSPGSASDAITVGAVELNATKWVYSNYGACVDVFAPGVSITSAWHTSPSSTKMLKGTSHAVPFVSGLAASILSNNPTMTPAAVTSAVIGSATKTVAGDAGALSTTRIVDPLSLVTAPAPSTTTTTTTTIPPTTTSTTVAPAPTTTVQQTTTTTVAPKPATYSFSVPPNILRIKGRYVYRVWLSEPGKPRKIIAAEYLNGTQVSITPTSPIPAGAALHVTYLRVG
jgi:hypothetical protein